MDAEPSTADAVEEPEQTVEGSDVRSADAFCCPNGCGPMTRRRCKLSCEKCGYYDSCSDFC